MNIIDIRSIWTRRLILMNYKMNFLINDLQFNSISENLDRKLFNEFHFNFNTFESIHKAENCNSKVRISKHSTFDSVEMSESAS